jgi:MFS family permease
MQRHAFLAAFLGWTLDSLDFFLLVFCVNAIAGEFRTQPSRFWERYSSPRPFVPWALCSLACWPTAMAAVPVLMFKHPGLLSHRVGLRLCAFAQRAAVLRALFGIAMGGEWGVGAALVFETLPREGRGTFSGILQEGYAFGSILASAAFGLFFAGFHWHGCLCAGDRLAGIVHPGRDARAAGVLCAGARAGIAGLAGRSQKAQVARRRSLRARVAAGTIAFPAHVFCSWWF